MLRRRTFSIALCLIVAVSVAFAPATARAAYAILVPLAPLPSLVVVAQYRPATQPRAEHPGSQLSRLVPRAPPL